MGTAALERQRCGEYSLQFASPYPLRHMLKLRFLVRFGLAFACVHILWSCQRVRLLRGKSRSGRPTILLSMDGSHLEFLWCVGTAFELEGAKHLPQAAGYIPHALQVSAHYGCFSHSFLRHVASERLNLCSALGAFEPDSSPHRKKDTPKPYSNY